MGDFQSRWLSLFGNSCSESLLQSIYNQILIHYSEPHRAYHTFEHIQACLRHYDTIRDQLENPSAVELAIWFHDVVYDPKSNNNEEKSAEFAQKALSGLGCEPGLIQEVYDLILLTKHPSQPHALDEKFLLDIDLSILGSREEVFMEYENNVRQEYKSVPNFLYRRGRKKILKSFLDQDRVYQTDYFRELLETQARINIEQVIKRL